MHIVMSRLLMGAAGLLLAAWGGSVVLDYILPGSMWLTFLVLSAILIGLFGKAVYDSRVP